MKDLRYTTIANDKHSIHVATWQERKSKGSRVWQDHFKITIDGVVTNEGILNEEGDES